MIFCQDLCFVVFYSLFENVAFYSDSEPVRNTIQFVTMCHVWVVCWLGAVWIGWAGWVELAGFARGLFRCLTTCSTCCMAVFLLSAALIRQVLLASLSQCSALDSHRFQRHVYNQPGAEPTYLTNYVCV